MYKMCSTQSDEESEDDKNSLSSSFWSDGDKEKDEEEEDEIERMIDSKPAADAEDLLQGASEEVKSGLNNQSNFSKESLDKTNNDDEEEEEERCSSSPDSLAQSLMTSGYGTYKPEGQEGAEYRDDHTIKEFDQDSRGALSEMREDEEDSRSLSSFGDFLIEPTHKPDFNELSVLKVSKIFDNVACCREIIHITEVHSEQKKKQAGEEECDLHAASEKAPKEQHRIVQAEDMFLLNEKQKQEIEVHNLHGFNNVKKDVGGKVECEDPDESSSNKDIKFIDSRVNISSSMMYGNMCAEWEGNLRQDRGKCFPASKSAHHATCYCKEFFFFFFLLFGQRLRNELHVFGHLAIKRSALNNKLHSSLDI